jgi:hypothetical protein
MRSSQILQLGTEGNAIIESKSVLGLFQTPESSFEFVRWE